MSTMKLLGMTVVAGMALAFTFAQAADEPMPGCKMGAGCGAGGAGCPMKAQAAAADDAVGCPTDFCCEMLCETCPDRENCPMKDGKPCPQCPLCQGKGGASPAEWLVSMKGKLGLSDEQVKKLDGVAADFQKMAAARKQSLSEKMQDLRATLEKAPGDIKAIKAKMTAVAAEKIDAAVAYLEAKQKALAVLAAEQKEKL